MSQAILRPDAYASGGADWSLTGSSYEAALSDNSDDTHGTSPGNYYSELFLHLGQLDIPAGSSIQSIRHAFRGSATQISAAHLTSLYGVARSEAILFSNDFFFSPVTAYSASHTDMPNGEALTVAAINALQVIMAGSAGESYAARFYDTWLEVNYNSPPVAIATAPIGVSTNQSPTVTWSYSDPEGDSQARYIVHVYSQAQFSAGGFVPGVSATTYSSAWTETSATSHAITATLASGNYRAYVWVQDSTNLQSAGSYVSFSINLAGTVVVTGPTGTLTNTSQPTVTWTWSDPEGDGQERYQVVVTNTANTFTFWDSTEVLSSATSRQIGIALANGTYRTYVRAADVGSSGRYSSWAYSDFTLAVSAPPVPNPIPNWSVNLVSIAIIRGASVTPASEFYIVQYRDADSSTWYPVRGANPVLNPTNASSLTIIDYESRPGVRRLYRAAAGRTVSGQPFLSAWGSNEFASYVDPPVLPTWTLRDLSIVSATESNPAGAAILIDYQDATLVTSRPENQTVFRPLGRTRAVVQSGVITGEEGQLTLSFRNHADFAAFETMRASQKTLWLTTPYTGVSLYIRLGATRAAQLLLGGQSRQSPKRIVSVGFVEVDRPSV